MTVVLRLAKDFAVLRDDDAFAQVRRVRWVGVVEPCFELLKELVSSDARLVP